MSVSIKELRGIDEEALRKQIDFTGTDDELLLAIATHDQTICLIPLPRADGSRKMYPYAFSPF